MPNFNKEQQAAIDLRGHSVLVSAPAGSGKTRILVQRIVDLIIKDRYDVSQLLVLTFTEAAGNEMKQRLNTSLQELLVKDLPADLYAHVHRQLLALPHAYITTFHSFCKTLLDQYGYLVDIMPGFTINAAPEYIQQQVLDDCLKQWVEDLQFQDFAQRFNDRNDFTYLKELILTLYEKTCAFVDFPKFIEEVSAKYYQSDRLNVAFIQNLCLFYQDAVSQAISRLDILASYCQQEGIPCFFDLPDTKAAQTKTAIYDAISFYLHDLEMGLKQNLSYDTLRALAGAKMAPTPGIPWKNAGITPEVQATYNKLKSDVFAPIKKLDSLIMYTEETLLEIMQLSFKDVLYLLGAHGLISRFDAAYAKVKRQLNQLDFHDLEVYATKLLSDDLPVVTMLNHALREIMIDEYQDTNQIQENLVQKIATHDAIIPIFMVGDMKQSIYRFRQADPSIFQHKFDTFTRLDDLKSPDEPVRIDLKYNYRSQKTVLDSINYIFDCIMDEKVGGLTYYHGSDAVLRYDYQAKQTTKEQLRHIRDYDTDVLIGLSHDMKDESKSEIEAHMIAQHLLAKKAKDHENFRDFAILMRSTTDITTYKIVFEHYHIPTTITLSEGLMKTNEVSAMLALLEALVDPTHDIAMVSVLRNSFAFSRFDDNKLLKLRNKEAPVYNNLKASDDPDVIAFLEVFETLRLYAKNHTPYDTLMACLKATDYKSFLAQLINGEQRVANIDFLVEVFRGNTDYPYLREYLEFLKTQDKAPGVIASEDNDAVTFMTIHKSKGLQFKNVYVTSLQKRFNLSDESEILLMDQKEGVASKLRILQDVASFDNILCEYDNPYRKLLAMKAHKDMIDEEMRILYVAMTRAENKLILSAMQTDTSDLLKLAEAVVANEVDSTLVSDDTVVFNQNLRTKTNYLSWIMSALMRYPEVQDVLIALNENFSILKRMSTRGYRGLYNPETELASFNLFIRNASDIMSHNPEITISIKENRYETLAPYYNYTYPYEEQSRSIAVTTLQAIEDEEHFTQLDVETRSREEAMTRGTLVHNVLSFLSFHDDDLSALITRLYEQQFLTDEEILMLQDYMPHLQAFIDSPTYALISRASHIYREKPFRYKEKERVINGIFDLVFIVDDQVYVLDYKTDKITARNTEHELAERHRVQLAYYQQVLKEVYHQDIKAIVYYLETSQAITL